MHAQVSMLSMIFMAVSGTIALMIPLALIIFFRRRKGADLISAGIGAAVMILFAFVLESGVHKLVAQSPLHEPIGENFIAYGIYGGVMAALFEEVGRYLAMRFLMKKQWNNPSNALMYGAGHGGIEAIVLLTITMINNLAYSFMINRGMMEGLIQKLPQTAQVQMQEAVQKLIMSPAPVFLLGAVERISAISLQICLSVFVWLAVTRREKKYFILAFGLHFLFDTLAVLVNHWMGTVVTEIILLLAVITVVLLTARLWKRVKRKMSVL